MRSRSANRRKRRILSGTLTVAATLLLLALPAGLQPWAASYAATGSNRPHVAEPPRTVVDSAFPAVTGRTITVAAGGDLQKALDAAQPGDRIALEPRATYRGPFQLPPKQGNGWIVVGAASTTSLPPEGGRVDPSYAAEMPKLVAASGAVIEAGRGVHHYRFVGLDIGPASGAFLYAIVQLGGRDTEVSTLPHHIVFDRCYLHGDPTRGARRGIAMNSRHTAVVDSYLSDFKEVGADSQAIAGWNGDGPFKIANNYLEAAGENIMFGGADPTIRNLVPSDIEIRGNRMAKPLRWKSGHDTYEGVEWSVKNLFELKNARRVVVDGNVLEYNWPQGQNGFAVLFTVRNQDGRAPWSTVEDVAFTNNVVRHVGSGINVLGHDDNFPSQRVRRLEIRNNLFLDVGGAWGSGRLFQLLEGTSDVVIDHNTAMHTGSLLFGGDGAAHTGFVFENNIAIDNGRGISGSGAGMGLPALDRYFPASVVRRNIIVGGSQSGYPADNFFPSSLDEVGFVSRREGRLRLAQASRYALRGTDGRDPGAGIDAPASSFSEAARVDPRGAAATNLVAGDRGRADESTTGAAGIVFWSALALLGYVYFGYPMVAWLHASLHTRPHAKAPIEPMVSVIVAVHNEGERLAARIDNLLALDYPRDRLDIVVGSDGSTDDTVEQARRYEHAGVQVRAFRGRRGKAALLNALVPSARGEVVVFADARQRFDRNAVRALVANFADPCVGAVSGELMITADGNAAPAGQGTAFYWRYEKLIRSIESRVDSTVGATGAIWAVRRALFQPIPEDTILDDALIPLQIVRRGYRVLFEPAARGYDRASATAREEFSRKARTIAGTFQLFARERWLFNPVANRLWLQTLSHKGLRLALPALHLAAFVANLALLGVSDVFPYQLSMAAQSAFYASALFGCSRLCSGWRPLFVCVPYTICLLNVATIVGFIRMVTHGQPVTWERAQPTRAVPS